MKQFKFRESISLDNPDDVDYLYAWAQQADRLVKEWEKERDELRAQIKTLADEMDEIDRKFELLQVDYIQLHKTGWKRIKSAFAAQKDTKNV